MDVASQLQTFEESVSTYTGDDPLDEWSRFIEFLEKRLSDGDPNNGMSLVLDRLVQRFLQDERYSNDTRYVNYCIRCASYYQEPIQLYSYIHSKGIGTRDASLYVAWAQQFEQRGQLEQANAVYQTAMGNQAKPADTVLQQYRMFQKRTSRSQTGTSESVRNPLQNSQLVNQMHFHRESAPQCKDPEGLSQLPADRTVRTISRSEVSVGQTRLNQDNHGSAASLQTVPMYDQNELVGLEGSELCFEEVRANRYFAKRKQEEERRTFEAHQRLIRQKEEGVDRMNHLLEELDNDLGAWTPGTESLSSALPVQQGPSTPATSLNPGFLQQSFRHPPISNNLTNQSRLPGLRLNSGQDLGQKRTEEAPASHMQQDWLRAPITDTLSMGRSTHSSGQACPVEDRITAPSRSHRRPEATGHFSDYQPTAPLSAVAPQASLLQASLVVQAKPEQNPRPFGLSYTAPHKPAYSSEAYSGVPRHSSSSHLSGSVNHPTSSFQQHNGRDNDVSVSETSEMEGRLDVSQGGTGNLSHITPNTSLGLVHATPSRAMPSPTVNTLEALGVIMDMFQAPTFVHDDPLSSMSMYQAEKSFDAGYQRTGAASSLSKPTTAVPFAIFQDDNHMENSSAAPSVNKAKPARALAEIPVSKPEKQNETPLETISDESTMWGARYNYGNSLAACPNSTRDFALSADLVSTPSEHKAAYSWDFNQDQDLPQTFVGDEENPTYIRQPTKLSPIMEQSPPDDKLSETTECPGRAQGFAEQGTIVGEGLALAQRSLAACSITEVHHPPAMLSFRDQTLVHTEGAVPKSPPKTTGPGWEIYVSPEQPPKPVCPEQTRGAEGGLSLCQGYSLQSKCDISISPVKSPMPAFDVPMSPECAPKLGWLVVKSPEVVSEPDFNAFMSPHHAYRADFLPQKSIDIPMSPEPKFSLDVPMSPDPGSKVNIDVPMSPAQGAAAVHLVSNPWDDDLISSLLAQLSTPLTFHPNCITWKCNIPSIAPKITITMGKRSLQVDCILGKGAFATVYQATDLTTSEKMILKVQKPANPWEFYINTQLNSRLQPGVRHLFNNIHSAHLFQNGSVLVGELQKCGTLLNAVNLYKNTSDKTMPQPLVLYFTTCILHMVELLHSVHIVHADIKPDNFLLGERFLENKSFDPENLDHGLALIDLGQSIDMTLFPEDTAFTGKCMTSGFQCTEMLSGRPWNYQTDYFGIAGTVYCMIFGTYMQVRNEDGIWKTNAVFRRNPHSDLWTEFFHTLLNVPDCNSLPCLHSLRSKMSAVLQQNYSNKLLSLKSRLVVQLLESKSARR